MAPLLLPHRAQIHWSPQLQGRGYQSTALGTEVHMWSRAVLAGGDGHPGLALSCLCGPRTPAPEQPCLPPWTPRQGSGGSAVPQQGTMGTSQGAASLGTGIIQPGWDRTSPSRDRCPPCWGAAHSPCLGQCNTPLCPSLAPGGIFHSRMEVGGRRVFAAAPSSPSPRPSLERLRKAPATFVSRKVRSKSLPGERAPWRGPGTSGGLGDSLHPTFQRSHPAYSHAAAPCLLPGRGSRGSG